jgi:homoserine/homoserine lactone efflux protein
MNPVIADVVFVTAVALGLGALLRASEVAFSVIKWVGVAYLAYLGICPAVLERPPGETRR